MHFLSPRNVRKSRKKIMSCILLSNIGQELTKRIQVVIYLPNVPGPHMISRSSNLAKLADRYSGIIIQGLKNRA